MIQFATKTRQCRALVDSAKPLRGARRAGVDKSNLKRVFALSLVSAVMQIAGQAQTFTTLVSFNRQDGERPSYESLVQGINGDFYGTTTLGGASQSGTIFVMTPQGQLIVLDSLDDSSGIAPQAGLLVSPNGTLYGTAAKGGASEKGTVFQITLAGTLTTLNSFTGIDGSTPQSALVQATNGLFYGTTLGGGVGHVGTVFVITPAGSLESLHGFSGTDGASPWAGLVQAGNGVLYGTTSVGGVNDYGTIFRIGLDGAFATLYSFGGLDGAGPWGGLVQGADGNLYGTTTGGGANDDGTVFRISPAGELTTLHSFDDTDGLAPSCTLVQGTDGNLYGTTTEGGAYHSGTIFRIDLNGTLATLYNFCAQPNCSDGAHPDGGLVQGTDGSFYGTTDLGNSKNYGTIFRISLGLGSFVKSLPAFGKAGSEVTILGTDLTGATGVSFNGATAAFSVVSPTAITATVPFGATTGIVRVAIPGGVLASNVPFQIL